ncbi:MAG: YkgJ family cysteine cluster protein [Lachnospiraceae bacterium]|nr:YkgJ family cysteine cluster protein [Lachnospiraceae bacterium]
MNRYLNNIADNLVSMKLGLDDTFKFHCTMCGECCLNREDILLSSRDIYNMSKEMKTSTEEFFKKYCEVYVGEDSRIPIVRLKPKGIAKKCPLLKNQKCRVHNAKPVICAMFPVGRYLIAGESGDGLCINGQNCVQYIFNNPRCGDCSETHTVREWLESFGVPVNDEYFLEWSWLVAKMSKSFRKAEKIIEQSIMERLWTVTFAKIYLDYSTEEEFLFQFETNAREVSNMLDRALGGVV